VSLQEVPVTDVRRLHVSEIAPYTGEAELPGIRFRPARKALGVTAWGMNVIELDPHTATYPAHDHTADGQEEVYVVLTGSCTLEVDGGAPVELRAGDLARVGPAVQRKLVTTDAAATVLAIGSTPGKAYEPPPWG
jgi:uncharacterized cupin superfamily protein